MTILISAGGPKTGTEASGYRDRVKQLLTVSCRLKPRMRAAFNTSRLFTDIACLIRRAEHSPVSGDWYFGFAGRG